MASCGISQPLLASVTPGAIPRKELQKDKIREATISLVLEILQFTVVAFTGVPLCCGKVFRLESEIPSSGRCICSNFVFSLLIHFSLDFVN